MVAAGLYPGPTEFDRVDRMLSEGFLYRRLAPIIPCALRNVAGGDLLLHNKWQISSLRDVFLSSHYWRLFEHLTVAPSFVVDLGGHCGHFAVLTELVIEDRFGQSHARYLVVEAFADLLGNIRQTFDDTGIASRCTLVHGLVGRRVGSGELRINRSNLLESSVASRISADSSQKVAYVDLLRYIPEGKPIDILKVDIEGSEYDLVDAYPTLIRQANLVVMEIHTVAGRSFGEVLQALEAAGLRPCLPHITKGSNLLVTFKREVGP